MSVVQFATEIEYYVFAAAFVLAVSILATGAAVFLIRAVLDHTFPRWRDMFRRRPKSPA